MEWQSDKEMFQLIRDKLFTAVVGDVLDVLGYTAQFLPAEVRGITHDSIVLGRAMPVLEADEGDPQITRKNLHEKAFGLMFEALDSLSEDEVYICTGSSPTYALWGEMMSTRAMHLGAVGAVMNGYHRDTNGILSLGFPCFSLGAYAQDQGPRGKVVDFNCEIDMNGVMVSPGDIVFGDRDGVVIIPKPVESQVIRLAWEKATKENLLKMAIEQGMSAVEAYEKFGIM